MLGGAREGAKWAEGWEDVEASDHRVVVEGYRAHAELRGYYLLEAVGILGDFWARSKHMVGV